MLPSVWARCRYQINVKKEKNIPASSSPSPPSSSRAAGRWPAWPSGPAGRSSPPPASGTWTNPLLCHTSCARNTHTETERSARTLIALALGFADLQNMHAWMCTYREVHWCNGPLKSNTHTCARRYSTETKTHIHRGTCHINAWRALQQMLISQDVFGYPKLLCWSFYDTSKSFFFFFSFLPKPANISVVRTRQHRHSSPIHSHTHLPDSKVNQVESRPYRRSELRGHMTSLRRALWMSHR